MRKYEMLVILDATTDNQSEEIAKIEELLKNLGGTVSKQMLGAKRPLLIPFVNKPKVIMFCSTLSLNRHRLLSFAVFLVCVRTFTVSWYWFLINY